MMHPQHLCKPAFCWQRVMCPQTLQKQEALLVRGQPSPMIHQGLTVQLFGPYPLPRAVSSLRLCASHSVAENAWTFLITFGGSRARLCLSQVFIVQAGVRNVECYNLGQRVVWGTREPGLWVLCILCPVPSEVSSSGRLSSPFSSPGSIGPLSSFSSLVVPGPDLGCTVSLG